jgi:hypothetical protein
MRKLLWIVLLAAPVLAQNSWDATELLEKAKAFGESTKTWRAEVIEKSEFTGPNIKLKDEVHTSVAVGPLGKMSRVNSGDDRTTIICDGAEYFYSGDGLSYEKQAGRKCDLPLIRFYEPSLMSSYGPNSNPASVSVVGEDHVRLADGERRCVLIRIVSTRGSIHSIRTMCIDPSQPLILRDVVETEDEVRGLKLFTTTTFTSFEINPTFPPDTFRITIPPGAHEFTE